MKFESGHRNNTGCLFFNPESLPKGGASALIQHQAGRGGKGEKEYFLSTYKGSGAALGNLGEDQQLNRYITLT